MARPDNHIERGYGSREAILGRAVLDDIKETRYRRDYLNQNIADLVLKAVRQGATWQSIGDVLGVSRQAAHRTYGVWVTENLHRTGKHTSLNGDKEPNSRGRRKGEVRGFDHMRKSNA